jgi:arylsulfatase A-like enzyme
LHRLLRTASSSLGLLGIVAGLGVGLGCTTREPQECLRAPVAARPITPAAGEPWTPPEQVPVALVDARVPTGEPVPEAGRIRAFDDVATVATPTADGRVAIRYTGLGLKPQAMVARVRVVPGQGGKLVVGAWAPQTEDAAFDPATWVDRHSSTIALEPGDAETEVRVDLTELVLGNFDDAADTRPIDTLAVTAPPGARVVGLELLDETSLYDTTTGTRIVYDDGVGRPSIFLHGGATVALDVDVPAQGAELRLHVLSVGAATTGALAVVDGADRVDVLPLRPAGGWLPQSASLDAFAGRRVKVELRAEGGGVLAVGDPRVVPRAPVTPRAPDVVLVLVDTLRADALSPWRKEPAVGTPVLDRLAREGVVVGATYTVAPWTKPAIPSLLTGLWATTHGVGLTTYYDRLPPTVPTLPGALRSAGWRTGSFSASVLGSGMSGLETGFDVVVAPRHWRGAIGPMGQPTLDQLRRSLLPWVEEEPERPFFAYVHALEVHEYYREVYGTPAGTAASYARAVADLDAKLGELLDDLRALHRDRDLLVVVASDHGEAFGDQKVDGYWGHGIGLQQHQIDVPLILWASGGLGTGVLDGPASLADIAPTLVDLVGASPIPGAQGTSLVPWLRGHPDHPPHERVPASLDWWVLLPDAPKQLAVVDAAGRKVRKVVGGDVFRHLLPDDPCEAATAPADGFDELSTWVDRWRAEQAQAAEAFRARYGASTGQRVESTDVEALKALGYTEESEHAAGGGPKPDAKADAGPAGGRPAPGR